MHQRALNGEILSSEEDIFPREDGSIDWTRWECRPWFASDGSVGGIIIYSEVITDRKKAEIALRKSEANLSEAQRIARIGSWEWDMVANKVKWSDEMYRVYDIEPADYNGNPAELIKVIHPEDLENFVKNMNENLESGTTPSLEYRVIHRDGSVHYIYAEGRMEFEANGKPIRSIGTAQDITERKKTELLLQEKNRDIEAQYEEYMQLNELLRQTNLDLEKAKAKAEESDKLKTAFLQNMSHEIRTPLNGILGFSNLLQDDDVSHEEMKEYTVIINQSGNRLLEIVNNVLDISKIETGQLDVRYNTIALNSLIKDLYNFFDPIAGLKGLTLNYKNYLEDEASFISTDDSKLNQVLSNLINNAIKFTNSGTVEFGYDIVADYIQFYVKDTGIGISAKNYKIIFERFTQIDLSITRGFEGAGLGLAISKGLVDLLGGTIWLESEVGRGTVFYFKIPYITTEQNDLSGIGNINNIQNLKKSKILIADDDYTSFVYLSKLLNRDEFTVLYAENGQMALQLVREIRDLDLVLMDIKMPIMDGFQATNEIRLINPDLPVIAQTAYAFREEQDKILASGFNDYISKPIDNHEFKKLINKYLK